MLLKRRSLFLLVFISFTLMVSCAHQKPQAIVTLFDEKEFTPYGVNGTSIIQGQAFLKTRGGDVKYGAGNTVYLIPNTSYSQEIRQAALEGKFTEKDSRWWKYVRQTSADGFGNFEFKNIPAGSYYAECSIFWQIPGPYGLQQTGGVVSRSIVIKENETVKVVLGTE